MSFSSPLPGQQLGRTDQGVDISAPPGTPVFAIATSKVIGRIANWFEGQPYEWFQFLTGPFKGQYWYGAEQIDFTAQPGQVVQQGQQIGTIAPTGTGTEFGFATASGQTRAAATTGYTEGQATPAGKAFRAALTSTARNRATTGNSTVGTVAQILMAHGASATTAAAILGNAYQESSWNPAAVEYPSNPQSGGVGLWQFTPASKLPRYPQTGWADAAYQTNFLLSQIGQGMISAMNAMSLDQATAYFMNQYERPNPAYADLTNREQGANLALQQIQSGNFGTTGGGYGGTRPGGGTGQAPTVDIWADYYNYMAAASGIGQGAPAFQFTYGTNQPTTQRSRSGANSQQTTQQTVPPVEPTSTTPTGTSEEVGLSLGGIGSAIGSAGNYIISPFLHPAQALHGFESALGWYWGQLSSSWSNAVNNLLGPLHTIEDSISFMDKVVKFFMNLHNWLRLVEFLTGMVLIMYAINRMFKQSGRASHAIPRVVTHIGGPGVRAAARVEEHAVSGARRANRNISGRRQYARSGGSGQRSTDAKASSRSSPFRVRSTQGRTSRSGTQRRSGSTARRPTQAELTASRRRQLNP